MSQSQRIFLLSPAWLGGRRSSILLREEAEFDLSVRLREGGAPLGEIYSFISGLYFRGKMAYAAAFGTALVITPGRGLLPPETIFSASQLREMGTVPIEETNEEFRKPLLTSALDLLERAGPECEFVLLGSIATDKYSEPLLDVLGDRLLFPTEFVGRGDMSRGELMLLSAESGQEWSYIALRGAVRRGSRPAKLAPVKRDRKS